MLVWNEYNCKVSGETFKFVECEQCKQKYVYTMVREAKGQGNSLYFLDNAGAENRAKNQAQAELKKTLDTDCDPVPCPKCGSYQQAMMAKLCREYRLWMFWVGVFMVFASWLIGVLGFLLYQSETRGLGIGLCLASLLGIGGGIGVIAWRRQMGSNFETNESPLETRLAVAEKRAVKVKNFKKWLEEQGVELDQPVES